MILLARLFFGGLSWLHSAWAWAKRNPMLAIAAILALFSAWQTWRLHSATEARDAAVEARNAARDYNKRFEARVRENSERFAKAARQNAERVASERKAIDDKVIQDYRVASDEWRARFDRLRAQANRSAAGADRLPAVPETPGGPSRPDSDTAGVVAVRIDDLEQLVQNSIQGEAIRQWAIANEGVMTSPE